jgi:hypothetical protein
MTMRGSHAKGSSESSCLLIGISDTEFLFEPDFCELRGGGDSKFSAEPRGTKKPRRVSGKQNKFYAILTLLVWIRPGREIPIGKKVLSVPLLSGKCPGQRGLSSIGGGTSRARF